MQQPRLNALFAPSAAAASTRGATQKNQGEENPDASAPFLDIQETERLDDRGLRVFSNTRAASFSLRASPERLRLRRTAAYRARTGAATCFLRESTPGIQTLLPVTSIPKALFTKSVSPSTMNWLPSARISVAKKSTNW